MRSGGAAPNQPDAHINTTTTAGAPARVRTANVRPGKRVRNPQCRRLTKTRLSTTGGGQSAEAIMLPELRCTSSPEDGDVTGALAAQFEGLCRSAATDITTRFFNAAPGAVALHMVQQELQHAEAAMQSSGLPCPFEGATTPPPPHPPAAAVT